MESLERQISDVGLLQKRDWFCSVLCLNVFSNNIRGTYAQLATVWGMSRKPQPIKKQSCGTHSPSVHHKTPLHLRRREQCWRGAERSWGPEGHRLHCGIVSPCNVRSYVHSVTNMTDWTRTTAIDMSKWMGKIQEASNLDRELQATKECWEQEKQSLQGKAQYQIVSPENIHTNNLMQTVQVVFKNAICMSMYIFTYNSN